MYYTYILRCADNSLYTGITTDIERRMEEHFLKGKKSAAYTRSHVYKTLEAAFECDSRQEASRLEYLIKRLSKQKKELLIKEPFRISELIPEQTAFCPFDISGVKRKLEFICEEGTYFRYDSPIGKMYGEVKGELLCGLWFECQLNKDGKNNSKLFPPSYEAVSMSLYNESEIKNPTAEAVCRWLDIYFSGNKPEFMPKLFFCGSDFSVSVWKLLEKIPYGKTVTYGQIAAGIAEERGVLKMSAQAVGSAVGRNPISVIVPCHRVIGSDGSLTGYAGGIHIKEALLKMEGAIH